MGDDLQVDPIAPAARAPKKAKKAAKRNSSEFGVGDDVLIARKHLHGIHAVVQHVDGDQVVARVNEGQFEGFLVQFSSDEFESANAADLKKHHNDRLDWDRYEQ